MVSIGDAAETSIGPGWSRDHLAAGACPRQDTASSSQLEVADDQSAVRAVISRCASESLFGDG